MRDLQIPDRVIIGGDNTKKGKEAIQSLVNIFFLGTQEAYILTKD
jgi:UDP-glucose 6-dehydrogenase